MTLFWPKRYWARAGSARANAAAASTQTGRRVHTLPDITHHIRHRVQAWGAAADESDRRHDPRGEGSTIERPVPDLDHLVIPCEYQRVLAGDLPRPQAVHPDLARSPTSLGPVAPVNPGRVRTEQGVQKEACRTAGRIPLLAMVRLDTFY